jgi:IS5 family transposase
MRQTINPQLQFGQVDISTIEFNPKSRDDIPRILRGLQYIYATLDLRTAIFELLEKEMLPQINKRNGRPGMELWKILVLGVLRLDLNCDYDRLLELANHHDTIRQMLGHADIFDKKHYELQTIKDNVSLLTEELLIQINEIIVNGGQALIAKKSEKGVLHGRCDSFVVETNVHYPTDINLLLDAMRKVLALSRNLCTKHGLSDLRQSKYNYGKLKQLHRKAQKAKRGGVQEKVQLAHHDYINRCATEFAKVTLVLEKLNEQNLSLTDIVTIDEINKYINHAKQQIDQTVRRVIHGEVIPHHEKSFSLFEPHTEWISKGKAGVPVEFGVRVCILEDQYQFILQHRVMEKQTDDKVAVAVVTECQKKFPNLTTVSFDKGFHSPENQRQLQEILEIAALPRKGKLSTAAKELESSAGFRQARKRHAAVESAINGLEVHGLDYCPDHGIIGFRRYVALAVVARNIHRIGDILYQKEQKKLERKRRRLNAANNCLIQQAA